MFSIVADDVGLVLSALSEIGADHPAEWIRGTLPVLSADYALKPALAALALQPVAAVSDEMLGGGMREIIPSLYRAWPRTMKQKQPVSLAPIRNVFGSVYVESYKKIFFVCVRCERKGIAIERFQWLYTQSAWSYVQIWCPDSMTIFP